jgi:branched-chain amino acid transport system permease protein
LSSYRAGQLRPQSASSWQWLIGNGAFDECPQGPCISGAFMATRHYRIGVLFSDSGPYPDVALYYVVLGLLVAVYLGLRILVNSRFGNVLVALRENPERAEMLGYDIRKYQLAAFVIGSSLAGLSGVLYTSWGQYITPSTMGITAAALPIIWVAVGGRSDLTATLIGTLLVLSVFQALTIYGSQYALVVMGLLLVVTVLVAPKGIIGTLGAWIGTLGRKTD